jgi:GNAT superfamily N-acetyltransferase
MSLCSADSLNAGVTVPDKTGNAILYRYVRNTDSVDMITTMLHDAYRTLSANGMRFVASYQDADTTRRRMARGETIVAADRDTIVGTITLQHAAETHGSPFYDRPDVAAFGQFAVNPTYQNQGIGAELLKLVEQRTIEQGICYLALDTAEHASDLISLYKFKGYQFVEYVQWPQANYRSVVMAKRLRQK